MAATGKTFFTWLGPVPSITIMNPRLIKEVYNKVYDFPKTHTFPLLALITDGLANADGDKWAKHRRFINPAFHFEKIKVSRFSFLICQIQVKFLLTNELITFQLMCLYI